MSSIGKWEAFFTSDSTVQSCSSDSEGKQGIETFNCILLELYLHVSFQFETLDLKCAVFFIRLLWNSHMDVQITHN